MDRLLADADVRAAREHVDGPARPGDRRAGVHGWAATDPRRGDRRGGAGRRAGRARGRAAPTGRVAAVVRILAVGINPAGAVPGVRAPDRRAKFVPRRATPL